MTKFFVMRTIGVFLIVIFLGLGGGYVYRFYERSETEKAQLRYHELLEMGDAAHASNDLTGSISHYEKVLAEQLASDMKDAVDVKSRLAADLFMRNTGDDRARAASLYKAMVLDSTLDPHYRAVALNNFLELFNRSYDREFARQHIFTGELFSNFIKDKNNNVYEAVTEAYRYSYALDPSAVAAFRIAHWYGAVLRLQYASLSDADKEILLNGLKEWTQKGEGFLVASETDTDKTQPAYLYQLDAFARQMIGEFSQAETAEMQYKFAEDAFRRSLDILAAADTVDAYKVGLYVRYYYALMLADRYGLDRQGDIQTLLAPIVTATDDLQKKQSAFISFFKNAAATNCKKDVPLLAKSAPEFYQYLVVRGAGCP